MSKLPLIKNVFWIFTIAAIVSYYLILKSNVDSLKTENNQLADSLKSLKHELIVLDSFIQSIEPVNFKLDATFNDTIIGKTENSVTVKFIPLEPNANSYHWDFGDKSTSGEIFPVHIYKLGVNNKFIVKLDLKKNDEQAEDSRTLIYNSDVKTITADFEIKKIQELNTYVLYKFVPSARDGDTYEWSFNDTLYPKNKFPDILRTFKKSESKSYQEKIKLVITKSSASASSIKNINISKSSPNVHITFSLDKDTFYRCDPNLYSFKINPSGGTVKGPGVFSKGNSFYFKPSNIKENKANLTYSYLSTTASFNVTIKDYSTSINYDSTSDMQGNITFTFTSKDKSADEYLWELKENNKAKKTSSNAAFVVNDYNFRRNYNFSITLTVKKQGCTITLSKNFSFRTQIPIQ